MDYRKVLYCCSYGLLSVNKTAFIELKRVFPEHFKSMDTFTRDNQQVIDYMIKNGGLARFQGDHCILAVAYVHKDAGFKISEYDGMETVIPVVPYEKVIDELVRSVNGEISVGFSAFTKLYINNDKNGIKQLLKRGP
jgi:hypothetical protein